MQKPLILAVEDNSIQRMVLNALADRCGYNMVLVGSAREALSAVAACNDFDLIFMDWQLGEHSGLDCTRDIRELEKQTGRHVPITAMTAHAMTGDRNRCLAAGMDDYLSKPFTLEEFRAMVDKWRKVRELEERRQQAAS